jgi:hypothetical protein
LKFRETSPSIAVVHTLMRLCERGAYKECIASFCSG